MLADLCLKFPVYQRYVTSLCMQFGALCRNNLCTARSISTSKTKLQVQHEINLLWYSLEQLKDFESEVLAKIREFKEKATEHGQ